MIKLQAESVNTLRLRANLSEFGATPVDGLPNANPQSGNDISNQQSSYLKKPAPTVADHPSRSPSLFDKIVGAFAQ